MVNQDTAERRQGRGDSWEKNNNVQVNGVLQDKDGVLQDEYYGDQDKKDDNGVDVIYKNKGQNQDKNDEDYGDGRGYQDADEENRLGQDNDGGGMEEGLGQDYLANNEVQNKDFGQEMAKLDMMEKNRNERVLNKNENLEDAGDENADKAEIEDTEDGLVPAVDVGEQGDNRQGQDK